MVYFKQQYLRGWVEEGRKTPRMDGVCQQRVKRGTVLFRSSDFCLDNEHTDRACYCGSGLIVACRQPIPLLHAAANALFFLMSRYPTSFRVQCVHEGLNGHQLHCDGQHDLMEQVRGSDPTTGKAGMVRVNGEELPNIRAELSTVCGDIQLRY